MTEALPIRPIKLGFERPTGNFDLNNVIASKNINNITK